MAYAAVISLMQTIQRLRNSSRFSRESLGSASEEAASLQRVLKGLDDHGGGGGGGERLDALDGQIREAASKLEDFLILHQSDNGGDELVSSEMMRWFAETAKKLREDYAAELDNDDGGEGEGGGAESSETDDSGADMVGYSDELNHVKWHMRNAVRPDDWAAVSMFGRPGTGRSYGAWEVFQCSQQLQTFHCGVWVTVAPNSHRKDILGGILSQARIYLNCGNREVAVGAGQDAAGLKGSEENEEEFAIRFSLLNILAGRRYIIVLDNVNNTGMLEYLLQAFPVQNNGSVVLVTTSAVDVMNHRSLLLSENSEDWALQYEDMWWDLLRSTLLGWQPISSELEEVGRKAVRNCRGRYFCLVKLIFLLWKADRSVEAWSQVAHDEHHPIFHEIVDELSYVRKIKEDLNNFTASDKAALSYFIEHVDVPTNGKFMKGMLFPERKFFPKMEVISFVGMAGIGKTTFVKKVYEYVKILSEYENIDLRYYDHCVWLTVGPKYKSEDIFTDILAQIFPDIDKMEIKGDGELAGDLIQLLLNKRLLIVLDDVWSEAPLEHLVKLFPNIKGRAFVTTRIGKVARSEKVHIVREMHLLSKEESWKLLCEKVFVEEDNCPFDLRRSGMKIAENCDGLPLTILKIASLISKDLTAEYWNDVAKKNSDFVSALQDLSETLIPIYSNLPQYLKPCFLYMGVFPESCEVSTYRIIKLWSAEGFLEQGDEEFAVECLLELVDRNLLMRSDSAAKTTCRLNSVLWYLTNTEAARSSFFYVLRGTTYRDSIKAARRFCIRNCILLSIKDVHCAMMGSASTAHSFLCSGEYHQYPVPVCWELRLLRVLDAAAIRFYDFPIEAVALIHLRYLAITCDGGLPSTISNLRNLEVLIVSRHLRLSGDSSYLPMEIWDMKELRHIQVTGSNLPIPNTSGAVLPNLVTLLDVGYHTFTEEVLRGIPNLQKLGIQIDLAPGDAPDPFHEYLNRISSLSKLESLECVVVNPEVEPGVAPPAPRSMFPPSLERLSLSGLGYPWEYMSIIEELKNLRVLELRGYAFQGEKWETGLRAFRKLERLVIEDTDLVWWKTTVYSFRKLKHLIIKHCYMLEEVPSSVLAGHHTFEVVDCNPLAAANWKEMIRMRSGSIALPAATDRHSKLHMNFSWEVGKSKSRPSLPGIAASALRPPPPVHLPRRAVIVRQLLQGQVEPSRAEMHRHRDHATSRTGAMHHDPLMQDPPRQRRGMGDADVDEISTPPRPPFSALQKQSFYEFPRSGSYSDVDDHQMHLLKQIQQWYIEQQQRLAVQEQPSMSITSAEFLLHQSHHGGDELLSSEMRLREDYAAELDNDDGGGGEGGGGSGGSGASSSETDDSDAHMVGYSDELNVVKWHMTKAVRPDDWAAASIFGKLGTGRTYAAWEVFQYVRQVEAFKCCVWAAVGPRRHRKAVLLGILCLLLNIVNGNRGGDGKAAEVGEDDMLFEVSEEDYVRGGVAELLAGKKYMIVLDDVDDTGMLDYLLTAFPVQNNGSLVLVTTSAVDVRNHPSLRLTSTNLEDRGLQYEDMWWGLLRCKLSGPVSPELEEVGRKAVRNCGCRFFCFVKLIFFLWSTDWSVEAWSQIADDQHHPIFHEIIDELSDVRKIKEDLNNFTDSDKAVLSHFIEDIDAPTGVQFMKEKLFPKRKFFPNMEVISFVGMAGIGKTTFVKRIYEYVKILPNYEHCAWLTLGPKYKSEDIFIDILAQIFPDIDKMVIREDAELASDLIQVLLNKRVFIVLDDVWSEAPLEHLAKSFPNIKGRAFLTTRIGKVARSEKMHIVRQMHLLSKEESWKLLCQKVFIEEDNCPFDLRKSGMKIAENCDGLPLAILKVASLVSRDLTAEYWDDVAKKNSDFVSALQDLSDTLEAVVEEQRPAAALLPPYASSATPRPLSPTLQTRFAKYMSDAGSGGRVLAMVLKESDGNSLEYDFFADIVDQSKDLVIGAIDLYMLALRIRLIAKNVLLQSVNSDKTIVCDTDLFIYLNNEWVKICNHWRELQSTREEDHVQFGDESYRSWRPEEEWVNAIRGIGVPNTQRSWINATQVIVPCLVGSHYVVCRLDLHEGICELYDSLHYCLNEDTRAYRVQQLSGILKLLARLLLFGEWFAYSPIRSPNFQNRMEFILRVAAPTLQFNQADNISCGVFCCMQVERLIADSPSIEWGHDHVTEYRWNIAARIFDLCETLEVELEDLRVCPDLSN
ncbi:uncharacterized protein LOC130999230 isoform X2 [Salvia miltiorrhiza]|uniref:uncharacterized protein LOC130999230 isoform X2 n=1 Tax=Salvia miltiorrhiza TaxID=226208 RepID=UPI0025AC0DD5|nr:uncharacterized protein LOC130999230 isoform X2 [Salvia miltiorrhiza]